MKASLIFISLAVLVLSVAATPDKGNSNCPSICTADYRPVCGYDGVCYQGFGNACLLDYARCSGDRKLKAVSDLSLCQPGAANLC